MKDVLSRSIRRFKKMYAKRAFVHHFLAEGMEESWFEEAKEDMLGLEQDFDSVLSDMGAVGKNTKPKTDMAVYGKKIGGGAPKPRRSLNNQPNPSSQPPAGPSKSKPNPQPKPKNPPKK
jgi:hypothetical protein